MLLFCLQISMTEKTGGFRNTEGRFDYGLKIHKMLLQEEIYATIIYIITLPFFICVCYIYA